MAQAVRHLLQAAAVCRARCPAHREHGDEKLLQARQKRSVDTQPDQAQREKNRGRAEGVAEKNLRAGGQRLAPREAEQSAEQNADGVEKCAGHAQLNHSAAHEPSRKFFAPAPQSLLLKGGWPATNQLPAARGAGFRRFTWRRDCPTSWSRRCRWCFTKISACRTQPSRFTPAGSICRGSSSRCGVRSWTLLKTRRQWIWAMQLLLGAGLAGVALTIPAPHFFQLHARFFLAAGVQLGHA